MKTRKQKFIRLLLAGLLPVLALFSCIKERETGGGTTAEGESVVRFSVRLPGASHASRALTGDDESHVQTIDILMFEQGGGVWKYKAGVSGAAITTDGTDATKKTFTITMRHGDYDLVMLANARERIVALDLAGKTKSQVLAALAEDVSAGGKWPADGSRPIPMWGEIGDITIDGSTEITEADGVTLTRMVARVDVRIAPTVDNFTITSVDVYNYNTKGSLAPLSTAWNSSANPPRATAPNVPAGSVLTKGPLEYNNEGGKSEVNTTDNECASEIYIFEAENHAGAGHAVGKDHLDLTCIVVGGVYGTDADPTYYRADFSTGTGDAETFLDVIRNHHYTFTITKVNGPGYATSEEAFQGAKPIDFTVSVTDWGAENRTPLPLAMPTVSPDKVLLSYSAQTPAPQTLAVNCTYNDGSPAKNVPWTLTVPAVDATWLKLSLNADGSNAQTTVSGTESKTVYLVITANGSTTNTRSTGLLLNGETAVAVTQSINLGGVPNTPLVNTYVGAFWRADQTGERIIRISNVTGANVGDWTASVVWMDARWTPGDIVLASGGSSDPNVNYSTVMTPGDAEDYPVTGDATSISGTVASGGNIIFRIGLKSNYTATEDYPARYAVLLIAYGSPVKYQKIYLRQGHDPDRLMRPENPYSKQFSPYNLTATTLDAQVDLYGTQGSNPSKFTDYPTQGGAFFQWAGTTNRERFAYNAHINANPAGWLNSYPSTYWNTLHAIHETCPSGYRRPNDGIINGVEVANGATIASSEMRQSLYEVPPTSTATYSSNSVRGYYADGFFDRRAIVNSPNGAAFSAVSVANEKIAYIGHLFYNSTTNASLFFPASGHRSHTYGTLTSAGINGYYWSNSTSSTTAYGWALYVLSPISAYQNNTAIRSYGFPIRCIRDN